MKKTCVLWLMTLWIGMSTVTYAQSESSENREQMRAEMVKKQAEKQAKDLGLTGDTKSNFVVLYCQYQHDLMRKPAFLERQKDTGEKELTDEEAKARVEAFFVQQEEMIAQMQRRLEVQKTYRTEFAKILTPQQMVKVFVQARGAHGGQMGNDRGSRGGNRSDMPRPGGFGRPF